MQHDAGELDAVARFSDAELLSGLSRLVAEDRALTTRLIVHLAEVDARGLYRQQAYSSMFEYAVGELHLSESEAYVRIRAARVARQFPLVLFLLQNNQLHLTAIKLLAPHLTQDNHVQVLARARGLSRTALERLVAEIAPKPDVHPPGARHTAHRHGAPARRAARHHQAPARSQRSPTPLAPSLGLTTRATRCDDGTIGTDAACGASRALLVRDNGEVVLDGQTRTGTRTFERGITARPVWALEPPCSR